MTRYNIPPLQEAMKWPNEAIINKDTKTAIERWSILKAAYPGHPAPIFQAAYLLIDEGELKKAQELITIGKEKFPDNPNIPLLKAQITALNGRIEETELILKQAQEKYSENIQIWIRSADTYKQIGNIDQAYQCYDTVCSLSPDNIGFHIQRANFAMSNEDWERAASYWEIFRLQFPEHPAGYKQGAEALRNLGHTKEAQKLSLMHQYGEEIFHYDSQNKSFEKSKKRINRTQHLFELIWTKALFNLRSEANRNYLSYGWWMIEPLLHMSVYYFVFGLLLQRGDENFSTFLLTGLIPYMWFMKAVSMSSGSILNGHNLMLQVGVPSIFFPLVNILQATIKQMPVLILLLAFVWLQGHPPDITWIALIPVILVQMLFTLAFGCTVAAIIPFIRDLAYLVPTGLTFILFVSGIFFDYRNIPPEWQEIFLLNPIAFLLKCYRDIFLGGVTPNLEILFYWGFISTFTFFVILYTYNKLRYVYPRIVME